MSIKSESGEERNERLQSNPKKRRKISDHPQPSNSKKVVKFLFKKESKSSSPQLSTDTSSNSSQSNEDPNLSSDNTSMKKIRKKENPFSSIPTPRLARSKNPEIDEDEKFDSDSEDSSEMSIRGFTDDDDDDDLSENEDTMDYVTLRPRNTNLESKRSDTIHNSRNATRWGRIDSPTTNSSRPGLGRGFAFPRPPPLDLNRHPFFDRRNDANASQDLASILGFPFATRRTSNDSDDSDAEGTTNRPPTRPSIGQLIPPSFLRRLVFGMGMPRDPLSPTAGDGSLWEMNDNGIPPAPERDPWIGGFPFAHRIGFNGPLIPLMFIPDPDNMSYEELLELGERIGTVKLVFSEDVINTHSCIKTLDENEIEILKKNDTMDCKICIEDFESGNNIRILRCGHKFHKEDCIDRWLKDSKLCPVCRQEVADNPPDDKP